MPNRFFAFWKKTLLVVGLSVIVNGAFCVILRSVTACRQSVRRVFDLGCVVAYYAVLVVDVGVAS